MKTNYLEVLSSEEILKIDHEARRILEEVGVKVLHDDCLNVGEFYTVSWFGNGLSVNEVFELNLCKGMNNPRFCTECRDKDECRILGSDCQSYPKTCQNCR